MQEETKRTQWVIANNFKIFDEGLWEKTEPNNSLSELVEVSELEYIGLEGEIMIYKCNDAPKAIKDLVKYDIGDDTHVYLALDLTDREQRAMIWPY
jgi:hypothetical protein